MFSRIPLTALRAFEAAARLSSFKEAANELSVTPTAVSHQIKTLETWLGLLLFERKAMGVSLTPVGQRLFDETHAALRRMAESLDSMRPASSQRTVVLTTTPALASGWLIPRLHRFHARYPQMQVDVQTSDDLVDLERDARVDLAIRCTVQSFPALTQHVLFEETFGAFAAAEFDAGGPIELIAVRCPAAPIAITWEAWCEQAGRSDWLQQAVFRYYDDEHYALQAALHGRGAVLASSVLVVDHLATGALRPIAPSVRIPGARYLALCRPGRERASPTREFLAWLNEEADAARAPLGR